MPLRNADIAAVFEEIADLLELSDENPFRVRAYRGAALEIARSGLDLPGLVARGEELPKISGVGADLAGKIREIVERGSCTLLDDLRARFPSGITALFSLTGVGPRRVRALYDKLGVASLADLQRAAQEGRLRSLPGFGEKSEAKILEAVQERLAAAPVRVALADAERVAEPLRRHLEAEGDPAVIAGSYRRRKPTVGDLDFVVASKRPRRVIERFVHHPDVRTVLAQGSKKASVVLASGLQADLRVVAPESLGAALHYFTGSKAHNIAVRRLALKRGLKINEYGVFRGTERIAGETEESVYAAVGLRWVRPEQREGEGDLIELPVSAAPAPARATGRARARCAPARPRARIRRVLRRCDRA